jgi:hypothetical protein
MDDAEVSSYQQRSPASGSTPAIQPWKPPMRQRITAHRLIDANTEQIQRIPSDMFIEQQVQPSTHLSSLEPASLPIDIDTEETWHLPAIQFPIRRRSIFKVIWKWLVG